MTTAWRCQTYSKCSSRFIEFLYNEYDTTAPPLAVYERDIW